MGRADKRANYYDKLYKGKLSAVTNDGGVLTARDAAGRKIGQTIFQGTDSHKFLAKQYPDFFPTPKGYTVANSRLVATRQRNVVRSMKAADVKALGLDSKKEALKMASAMKKSGVPLTSADDVKRLALFKSTLDKQKRIAGFLDNKTVSVSYNENAWHQFLQSFTIKPSYGKVVDFSKFAARSRSSILKRLGDLLKGSPVKFEIKAEVVMKQAKYNSELGADEVSKIRTWFTSTAKHSLMSTTNMVQLRKALDVAFVRVEEAIQEFLFHGSGYTIDHIVLMYVNIAKYNPLSGSSYIETPEWLANKRAITNIENDDQMCFVYAVAAAVMEVKKDANRPTKYKSFIETNPELSELNVNTFRTQAMGQFLEDYPEFHKAGDDMPMTIDFVKKMEKYEDIIKRNINILMVEVSTKPKPIRPLRDGGRRYPESINLLLLTSLKQNHFVTVRSMSRLLSGDLSGREHKRLFCPHCLSSFTCQSAFDTHYELCKNNEVAQIKMPSKKFKKFENYAKTLTTPFAVYADFESTLVGDPYQKPNTETVVHNTHEVNSAKYIVVSDLEKDASGNVTRLSRPKVIKQFFYRGDNAVKNFLQNLQQDCSDLYHEFLHKDKPLTMSPEDEATFQKQTTCHICSVGDFPSAWECRQYREEHEEKPHPKQAVRDHDHLTGEFRGKAHHKCNLDLQVKRHFNVFFHNAKGYDAHFIMQEIDGSDKIDVIPINREKFITFSTSHKVKDELNDKFYNLLKQTTEKENPTQEDWDLVANAKKEFEGCHGSRYYKILFKDSMGFMASSLEKLAESLERDDFHFTKDFVESYAKQHDLQNTEKLFDLLRQKGVYPYEYVKDNSVFAETQLPPVEAFVSMLAHEATSIDQLSEKDLEDLKEDYQHAQTVWEAFGCKTFGDYHDLYLHSDVCLLGDIFQRFREVTHNKFGLDPCHYMSLPGLAFDGLFKVTGESVELLMDPDMYLFCEMAKFGGVSGTGSLRYAKANNPKCSGYDKSKPTSYLMYVDANSLYAHCMKQKLPYSNFEWEDMSKLGLDYLEKAFEDVDGDKSCFLEVDAYLPDEFHDAQNDYPCFPENVKVTEDMLSDWQKNTAAMLGNTPPSTQKLVPNLMPKHKYIVHAKCLKLWTDLGWEVTKIHRVLKFTQKAWMKPFIDICAESRKHAKTAFERDLYKLFANANFGKCIEDVRRQVNVTLSSDSKVIRRAVNKVTLNSIPTQLNNHGLMMLDKRKGTITLDKPVHTGVAIMSGLAKHHMTEFWYNGLKAKYGSRVRLVYTDTDSFIFECFTEDLYRDIANDKEFGAFFDTSNTKETGFFKDETEGVPIEEVVALRAKMYSLKLADGEEEKRGKGIRKKALKKITHENYRDCLFNEGDEKKYRQKAEMSCIRSHGHVVTTERVTKQALVPYDDKKFILEDGINQLSYGHWRICSNAAGATASAGASAD